MRVIVIRHGEVDHCWSRFLTSKGFDKECSEYDKASITNNAYEIPQIKCKNIYISTLPRSRETAVRLFPDIELIKTELIDEVPLRSCFDTRRKMPLWFWNFMGRLQWGFNSKRQPEGCRQTKERARQFVQMICNADSDCVVVTHGFYMHTLLSVMKKAGFRTGKLQISYRNGDCIVAVRL